jgi:2,3-bisphosphoglycerate-dependent phosphoglycerate mutase
MAYLVLIRHGESVWNAKGLWTGWTDVDLSDKGREEAREAGETIKDIHFSVAFTSALKRAQQTLEEVEKSLGQHIPTTVTQALNERNYGDLTGKNKWDIQKEYGDEQFLKWRRGWDEPITNGETLKDVYNRVVPYYQKEILPHIQKGENVLIAAHGNSLRSLVKYLDNLSDEEVTHLEIATGEVVVYTLSDAGEVVEKSIRTAKTATNA